MGVMAVLTVGIVAVILGVLPPSSYAAPGKDYYAILGVSRDATPREIRKAFKTLSVKYHPDKNPEGRDKFVEISNAYQVLSDPELRKKYDQFGEDGLKGPPGGGGGHFQFHDAFNVFEQFFGRGGGFSFSSGGGGAQFHFSSNMGGGHQQRAQHQQQQRRQQQQQQQEQPQELYDNKGDVVILDSKNFDELVLKDASSIWMVQFYSPSCKHCHNLAGAYKEAAKKLRGMVKVGVVNAAVETGLSEMYEVKGYPTIKLFPYGPDKSKPQTYDGPRHADGLANWALTAMPSYVTVIDSLETYRKFLADGKGKTNVLLFTSKKNVPPLFSALSKDYKDFFAFGAVLPSAPEDLMAQFTALVDVSVRPTLVVKEPAKVFKYDGPLSFLDIRRFLLKFSHAFSSSASARSETGEAGRVSELTKATQPELCSEQSKFLCVVALFDGSPSAEALQLLQTLSTKYHKDRLTFCWVDQQKQPSFVDAFPQEEGEVVKEAGHTVVLPSVMVWNSRKGKAVPYTGPLEEVAISSFLDSVISGGKRWKPLGQFPTLDQ